MDKFTAEIQLNQFRDRIHLEQVLSSVTTDINKSSTNPFEEFEGNTEEIEKSLNVVGSILGEEEVNEIEKAIGHKYFMREGSPGFYHYYYTKEDYTKSKEAERVLAGLISQGKGDSDHAKALIAKLKNIELSGEIKRRVQDSKNESLKKRKWEESEEYRDLEYNNIFLKRDLRDLQNRLNEHDIEEEEVMYEANMKGFDDPYSYDGYRDWLKVKEEIQSSITEIQEQIDSNSKKLNKFKKSIENDIEKGNRAQIGEVRIWNGKKMKKQANGKWMEVSEQGLTKKEHEAKMNRYRSVDSYSMQGNKQALNVKNAKKHEDEASKLKYREYDDSELEGEDSKKEKGNYTDSHLESLVMKRSFDERHFEDMNDEELGFLHSFANANLYNSKLTDHTKKQVKDWWKGSLLEISDRRKKESKKEVGKTVSGKSIYLPSKMRSDKDYTDTEEQTKDFSLQDHKDAYELYKQLEETHGNLAITKMHENKPAASHTHSTLRSNYFKALEYHRERIKSLEKNEESDIEQYREKYNEAVRLDREAEEHANKSNKLHPLHTPDGKINDSPYSEESLKEWGLFSEKRLKSMSLFKEIKNALHLKGAYPDPKKMHELFKTGK